jgi:pilus assembly protein CpaC
MRQSILSVLAFAVFVSPAMPKPLIQIGVEVVEVNETKNQKLGIEWMEKIGLREMDVPAVFKVGQITRDALRADLHFLEERGAADLLANPKLVTRDSSTATFHAGGELPYATSGSLGTVQVEFKPYGINLNIYPKLEETGEITLNLEAEVSAPDEQNAVSLAGNIVPGIRSRKITSQLTLVPGSTLTLAGLLQNDKVRRKKGVPGLMDIPILGRLFYANTLTARKTSIVVFVTPTVLEGGRPDGLVSAHVE